MKQKLLFLIVMLAFLLPARLSAFESGGINYNLNIIPDNDGNIIYRASVIPLPNDNKYSGDIVIPESVEYEGQTYSVNSIDSWAFSYCSLLTSVEIPNSVIAIELDAFLNCTSLTYVEIPNSVSWIGVGAFRGCSSLTSVMISKSVTSISDYAFCDCSSLTSVVIPNSVTSIGSIAFGGCSSLTSVEIPNSVTSIGDQAFSGCSSLTSVEIPNSVTSIGDQAFSSCSSLTSVEIPNSVTSIGSEAFGGCKALTSIVIPNSVTSLGSGAFGNCSSLTSIVIPNSVTSIEEGTFGYCTSLTTVEIPNSVTSIGSHAFYYCRSLNSVEIPNSVTSIGDSAFDYCTSLASVEIPNSVTSIGSKAFYYCDNLRLFIIKSTKVAFESYIFGQYGSKPWYIFAPEGLDCSALECNVRTFDPETTIFMEDGTILSDNGKTLFFVPLYQDMSYSIPEGVTKIPAYSLCKMHEGSFTLGTLTIPSTIEEIEPNVFEYTAIKKVNFTDWTKWYDNVKLGNVYSNPYWNSKPYVGGVQMVTPELPDGITEIPDYINYGLQFKDEIELPRSIKRIGAYAFYNNKELYSVILPRGLEEIGESAFEGCELLENPTFPSGLKKIEDGAYKGCSSITEIVLPEGLTKLGEMTPGETETDAWEIQCSRAKGVFENCTSLEKAVLVADIDYLDDNLFKGCIKLDKVYFPLNLKTIGVGAFQYCVTIDEITFPSTLETIGASAFRGNAYSGHDGDVLGKISKLVIPDGVKTIGSGAFAYQSIVNLSIGKGVTAIPDHAFFENTITTPKVMVFSEGLKEIGGFAFANESWKSTNIGSVILPSTVTAIGNYAFSKCYISELVVPDQVETLGSESCGIPSTLTLGSAVKEIAANAFDFEKLYTIRLKAHMPPTLSDAFPLTAGQNDQLTLIVNKGRHDTYNTNARWKQIDRIIEDGESEVVIYLNGEYSLSEEIRLQSGYMPSVITKMKVVGPLSDTDLRVIKENMVSLTSLDLSEVTNVTGLPANQFAGSLITDIVLPSNLETIGSGAFSNCRLLQLSELPATVTSIGSNAFSGCPGVNIKTLPAALESIGYSAFSNSGIQEFVPGEHLSEIGSSAFSNCTLLERADLSASAVRRVPDNAFSGCTELDEVILPASVEAIGASAFSGTALRNIDFASEVATIGDNAFSNNRRLVSATLPEDLTRVGSNLFSNCPRLISVSMPASTTNVGENMLSGDRKLANLSCAASETPEAESGAFNDLRYRYVTLTIPTLSFRKYISAPQWGKFENIRNTIQVSVDRGVKTTNAAEDEYQDMVREDELEAEQEAAAQQNGDVTPARAMRRAAARAKSVQNFATLFNGATLMSGGIANRVFITPDPGVNVTSILLDGEELIESFDGQSILLPEGKYGNLEIITDAPPVLAESILLSDAELSLSQADKATLTATVQPADTEDKTVKWSSSDESVATVDDNGEVTVTGVGNVVITAACGEISSECALKCYPQLGDANWNGSITVADAVDISNYVVKKKTAPEEWDEDVWTEFYTVGANANESEDGNITFADASAAIRIALAQPAAASEPNRIGAAYGKFNESSDALVVAALRETNDGKTSMTVKLHNSMDYVALQADIFIPDGLDIEVKAGSRAAKHSLETLRFDDNHLRVALFNLGNKAFAAGDDPILEIVADGDMSEIEGLTISNILAADSEANEYVLGSRMGETTGVEGVSDDMVLIENISDGVQVSNAAGKRIEIWTMEGQAVKSFVANDSIVTINLPAGIYIVKAGDKNLKVIL